MFATLEVKLIIAAIILALIGGSFFYVKRLHHANDVLKQEKTELTVQNKAATDTIQETDRRAKAVDDIDALVDQKRKQNEKVYQTKIIKVDNDVQQGKDRSVGPLLNDFFNDGLQQP